MKHSVFQIRDAAAAPRKGHLAHTPSGRLGSSQGAYRRRTDGTAGSRAGNNLVRTPHPGTTRWTLTASLAVALAALAAYVMFLHATAGPGIVAGRLHYTTAARKGPIPAYQQVVHQWRAVVASGVLSCLNPPTSARAKAAMNNSMQHARMRALTENVDVRAAAHAAAHSSLVLVANQTYRQGCRVHIEGVLDSVYADAMSRLGQSSSIWRGAVLGDLVAEERYGDPPATLPKPPRV